MHGWMAALRLNGESMDKMLLEVPDHLRAIAEAFRHCVLREPCPPDLEELLVFSDEREALLYLMHEGLAGALNAIDRDIAHRNGQLEAWEDAMRFFATQAHNNVMPFSAVRDGDAVLRIFEARGFDRYDDALSLEEVEGELRATNEILRRLRKAKNAVVGAFPHIPHRAADDERKRAMAGTGQPSLPVGEAPSPMA